jgi:hypothetical protein
VDADAATVAGLCALADHPALEHDHPAYEKFPAATDMDWVQHCRSMTIDVA